MTSPAVFLDRDGVLNAVRVRGGKPYPPASAGDLEIMADAPAGLAKLKSAGYRLIVVTNQPDVARGRQRREVVDAINAMLAAALPLDEFRVCFHDDRDGCDCRKPKPGLLLQAPVANLRASVLVGDRWRDIEAGHRAGVGATVFIDRRYAEQAPQPPFTRVASLAAAVEWILRFGPGAQR